MTSLLSIAGRVKSAILLSLDVLPLVALAWVLIHLVLLYAYGSVIIVEESRAILSGEIGVASLGLIRAGQKFATYIRREV